MANLRKLRQRSIRIIERIQERLNDPKVKFVMEIVKEISTAVDPLREAPKITPLVIGKTAINLAEFGLHQGTPTQEHYYEDYESIYDEGFSTIIYRKVLTQLPYRTRSVRENAFSKIHIYELRNGVDVRITVNKATDSISAVAAHKDNVEAAREILAALLWEQFADQTNVVLKQQNDAVDVEIDDSFRALSCEKAVTYSAYLKRCLAAGIHRSVLFYGPPGSGKSTLARTITDTLGMRTLRIRVEDLGSLTTTTLADCVKTFEPDAIIIDDFDRAHNQTDLLEVLENFKRHVKLLLTTANNHHDLDGALLRPGRLDEIIEIAEIDDVVILNLLGKEHEHMLDVVRKWPVAYIEEYKKRHQFLTTEEMEVAVEELQARVNEGDRIPEMRPDGSFAEIIQNMGKRQRPVGKTKKKKRKKRKMVSAGTAETVDKKPSAGDPGDSEDGSVEVEQGSTTVGTISVFSGTVSPGNFPAK